MAVRFKIVGPAAAGMLVACSLLGGGQAQAQTTAAAADSCPTQVDATQANALATVTVRSECRGNSQKAVTVLYGDDVFVGHFDGQGVAKVSFALMKPTRNEFKVRLDEEVAVSRSLDVPEFGTVRRATLIWQAPVRLKLTVVEPGSRLGFAGAVNEDQPNTARNRGRGTMDLAGTAPELRPGGRSATSEQSYTLAGDGSGVFSYYIEFANQGSMPAPPFCGDGALATVQYRFVTLENGVLDEGVGHETPRLPCGQAIARLQRRIQ